MKRENNNFNEESTDKLDISEINRKFYEQQYQEQEEEKKRKTEKRKTINKKTRTKKKRNFTPILVFLVTLLLFSTIALAIYTISINKKINDKIDESKLSKETEVTDELKPTTDMSTEEPEEDDEDFGEFEEITGSLTQDLNFRSGPGYEYETIGTIPRGTEVSGYIDKSGWLKIEYNGQTGYIGPQYVE